MRADDAGEARRPAQMLHLLPQVGPGLVADDAEIEADLLRGIEHGAGGRHLRQMLQMNALIGVQVCLQGEVRLSGEQAGKGIAQRRFDARLALFDRPGFLPETAQRDVHGGMDRRPVVHQRVVPVEQEGLAAAAVCLANLLLLADIGEYDLPQLAGHRARLAVADGVSSICVTGNTSDVVLVRKASAASFASARVKGRSSKLVVVRGDELEQRGAGDAGKDRGAELACDHALVRR